MSKYTAKQAIAELKLQVDEIDNVRKKPRLSPKFKSWQNKTSELLAQIFGRKARQCKEFASIKYDLAAFSNQTPESKFDEVFQQGLKNAAIVLSAVIKDIEKNGLGGKQETEKPATTVKAPEPPSMDIEKLKPAESVTVKPVVTEAAPKPVLARTATSNKVFVVYADGSGIKHDLTAFLSKIGIAPVLIEGKPGQLQLSDMFNKLQGHHDISYAVVLLDPNASSITHDVVFELGVLVGHLGQGRVCGLLKQKLDILANYSGISYVSVDEAGAWKFMMIKHLKDVGYNVDANLAL